MNLGNFVRGLGEQQ